MANYAGFGMEVTVVSTSPKKEKEAREVLGADHFLISKDEAQMSVRTTPSSTVRLERLYCRFSIYTVSRTMPSSWCSTPISNTSEPSAFSKDRAQTGAYPVVFLGASLRTAAMGKQSREELVLSEVECCLPAFQIALMAKI